MPEHRVQGGQPWPPEALPRGTIQATTDVRGWQEASRVKVSIVRGHALWPPRDVPIDPARSTGPLGVAGLLASLRRQPLRVALGCAEHQKNGAAAIFVCSGNEHLLIAHAPDCEAEHAIERDEFVFLFPTP